MMLKNCVSLMILTLLCMASSRDALGQWSHKEDHPLPAHARGRLIQPFTEAAWAASNFASESDLLWFRDAKYGMFVHFGLSTRVNKELSWGTCRTRKAPDIGAGPIPDETWQSWPKEFHFENYDAQEWVDIAKRAGFKYMVVIAKHHEGFHLWDTDQSDFKVTNTPFGRDYLKELADVCHAVGMPFGIYYSQRDWYHPDYMPVDPAKVDQKGTRWTLHPGETSPLGERHQEYIDYQFRAVRELCTRYGKIDVFWWDAAWWGSMFTAEMWDSEKLTRLVRELQPHVLQNNRCSVPGDFDTPEQRLGAYQGWRPWESCMCLTRTWCYSGTPPKSRDQILAMVINNACCDGNILLSWGPKWDGAFAEKEKMRLFEVGAWLSKNGHTIFETRGGPWKYTTWGGATRRGKTVYLHIREWPGETLRIPAIPGRRLISARLLDGTKVETKQDDGTIAVRVPAALRDPLDTIVELTMNQSIDDVPPLDADVVSIFADTVTYGQVVSRQARVKTSSTSRYGPSDGPQVLVAETSAEDFAFHTSEEANPWAEIDLGREVSVTGVRIVNRIRHGQERAATLLLSVSIDGETWHEVWQADSAAPVWELSVTDFRAGAHVPGRRARYLRLEIRPDTPTFFHLKQVVVWGSE